MMDDSGSQGKRGTPHIAERPVTESEGPTGGAGKAAQGLCHQRLTRHCSGSLKPPSSAGLEHDIHLLKRERVRRSRTVGVDCLVAVQDLADE